MYETENSPYLRTASELTEVNQGGMKQCPGTPEIKMLHGLHKSKHTHTYTNKYIMNSARSISKVSSSIITLNITLNTSFILIAL